MLSNSQSANRVNTDIVAAYNLGTTLEENWMVRLTMSIDDSQLDASLKEQVVEFEVRVR